ncbi:beta-glucosidase [Hephaestia caeni]|uniref:beta-glucosidase n=1 Tax=Hephaestia caeni TaxID=645617 RepID=A0A397NS57_9SPHN|nr:beta-glucosidase BglX [Hephaestia caeni]RIA37535.1 beta-glucosidase [Hephaestia caeni]
MKRMLFAAAAALSLATLSFAPLPLAGAPALAQAVSPDAAMRATVDRLIARMTLEEKAGQLSILGGDYGDVDDLARRGLLGGTNGVMPGHDVAAYTRHIQDMAMQSRLKIPVWFMGDVAHGYRIVMPVPLALAATWDTALVERVHRAAAIEATSDGVDWTFSPMLDIARDPRWGRVVEGAGEDPYLGSAMAVAQMKGFQGDDLAAKDTMLATAKHFAGYGAVTAGRDYNAVDLPPRLFRDVYLPPFKAVADAGIGSVMAAFNTLDGVPATSSRALLTGTLRDDWGWDGLIVSDYDAVKELSVHGVAADAAEAARMALRAGIDIDLHSGTYLEQLPTLVRDGKVPIAEVDAAVRRVLEAKYKLGLFDDPYRYGDRSGMAGAVLEEHRALARQAARQAMVLLRNTGVLPLKKAGRIAVIGPMADLQRDVQGPMPALGVPGEVVTMLAGVRGVAGGKAQVSYAPGVSVKGAETDEAGISAAVAAAKAADVAVLVLGDSIDMIGEGNSRASIDLPGRQLDLAKAVAATGTPVVAVVVSGRPLAVPWLATHADALVFAWLAGDQAGNALGDLLFGDANFSGRLPITVPRSLGQVPLSYDALPTGRPKAGVYTSRYVDEENTPLFPFGYGLSYTHFSYGAPRLDRTTLTQGGRITITVTVRNEGTRAGAAVPQLYVHDELASVSRPMRQLKGFRRIDLAPGEARDVTFTLTPDDLAFVRRDMTWGTEPGGFKLWVGDDSTATQSARFALAGQ